MILLDREDIFVNWYLLEKEYHYTDDVRKALNQINYFEIQKRKSRALSIHIVSKTFKKKYNINFSEEFLWTLYRRRKAHIKNAKVKFKEYELWKRLESSPEHEIKLCECGCGLPVKPGNKYINGHNPRFKNRQDKKEHTEKMRFAKQIRKENVIFLCDKK